MSDTENPKSKERNYSIDTLALIEDRHDEEEYKNFKRNNNTHGEFCMKQQPGDVHTVEKRFRALCQRYKQKKRIFASAASHYSRFHFFSFTVPLLLLQLAAALAPSFLRKTDQEGLLQTVSTAIAAMTAILIATDNKLAWEKKSERFLVASSGYNSLQLKAANLCIMDCTDFKQLEDFLSETGKIEDTVKESMPLVPEWIEKKVLMSEQRRKELKVIDYRAIENI